MDPDRPQASADPNARLDELLDKTRELFNTARVLRHEARSVRQISARTREASKTILNVRRVLGE